MRLISTLKRAKYVGAALVLLFAAMPVVPIANAFADNAAPFCVEGGDCYTTLQEAFNVAPTDGTATRVYLNSTDSVVKDGGAILRSGQNVTFDLKNKTYDISDNTVGSTGTETLAFQLLKGSTFYLKNGTITASAERAKMWLQNYANTTLNNVVLDASDYQQAQYVVSNNNGSLTVKGNTKIIANENGVAFDLWYGMKTAYNDGVTVTFDEDFIGTVEGKVEYGAKKSLDGWRDKTKLDIKNGTFDVTFVESSPGALTGANINVSGGTVGGDFPNLPANIDQGNVIYKNTDGTYVIDSAPDLSDVPARALVKVGSEGDTIEGLAGNDAIQNYAKFVGDTGLTFTKPNKVVATEAGLSRVKIEFEIYNSNGVRNTAYDRTIKIHAYTANDIGAVPMAEGDTKTNLALDFSVNGNTYDILDVQSKDESKMTIAPNGDGTYTVNAIKSGDVEIQGKVTINSDEKETTGWIKLGTVRVYKFSAAESVTIPVSTTALDVNGGVIANIDNPGAITVELEGDAATLEGTTADVAKITATAAGDATLIYKAGDTEIGRRTTIHAYVLPTLTDMLIQSRDSVGDLPTSATFPKLEGENLPAYSLTSGNRQLIAIEDGAEGTKIVRTRQSFQHSGNATVTVNYEDSLGTTDTFNVTVSKFTTNVNAEYDILQGGSVSFEMWEHNGRGEVVCLSNNRDCSRNRNLEISKNNNTYTVRAHRNTAAGKYSINFTDEFGDDTAATRNVDVYVYKMTAPSQRSFFAEMAEGGVEFTGIDVDDEINAVVPGRAEITAAVTRGDESAVDLTGIADGKVKISKPGEYRVTYTDRMAGGQGDVVGTYTATFRVYALEAAVDDEVVNINASEVYSWTIDASQTYGNVVTTIYRKNPAGEHNRRVYRSETRYEATGDVEDFTFDPAQYGEGIYTIRIENTSASNHDLPALAEEATFYAIEREYDFVMVKRGEPVEITSGSRWDVDYAEEYYTGELDVEGKTAVLDTSELPLGSTWAMMYHKFELNGEQVLIPLKRVTVIPYEVVPAEKTKELNPGEVTAATIKDLYERTAIATAGLIRDLVAAGVPEENVYCSLYDSGCPWGKLMIGDMMVRDYLTEEDIATAFGLDEAQAAMVNYDLIKQAVDEFKIVLGEKGRSENGLRVAALLNAVNSGFFSEVDAPLETEVRVTSIASGDVDATEKADIKKALSNAGIEVDNIDYYDVSVLMTMNGFEAGKLHKLNDKITVALAETSDPASGYTRQYFVVRDHNGTVTVLTEGVDYYIENGVIYVISDEFSTYAVAYKDTLMPKAPDTGDEAMIDGGAATMDIGVVMVLTLAAITVMGVAVAVKRK